MSAVATIAPRWALADAGVGAATVLIPLGGGVYSAVKAEQTIKSMLVARKVWALVATGRKIARDVGAQVNKTGTTVPPGRTVEIHRMGQFHRWTTPSGVFGRLGATSVKVVVADDTTGRIAAFTCAPHSHWTITDAGVMSTNGTTHPWIREAPDRADG